MFKARTATVARTGLVNGHVQHYTEQAPVPRTPFNADRVIRKGLFTAAIIVSIGAVAWSTESIGESLSTVTAPWAAYTVAGVFDATWLGAQAAGYYHRHDAESARSCARMGWVFLVVSSVALIVHGCLAGSPVLGIVGACAPAAAKVLWSIALGLDSVPLDAAHAAYVRERKQDAGVELALAQSNALIASTRQLTERTLLGIEQASSRHRAGPVSIEQAPSRAGEQRADIEQASSRAGEQRAGVEQASSRAGEQRAGVEQASSSPLSRENRIEQLADMLRGGQLLNGPVVERLYGVSRATANKYLKEARDQGPYL